MAYDILNFTYDGVNTDELGVIVKESNHLESFERDLEFVNIPGRSGDLLIDNGRYKNKLINVECYINYAEQSKTIDDAVILIEGWLYSNYRYKPLIFSNSNRNIEAVCTKVLSKELFEGVLRIDLEFNCKLSSGPVTSKVLTTSDDKAILTSEGYAVLVTGGV